MLVKQGIIPAAGRGTRLGPFTDAIPKELLPIGNCAVIEHVVKAMKLADIYDIIIVVGMHKHGISDYLGSGKRFDVNLSYVIQDERRGLADAVLAGKHLINDSFVVVLGDNYFRPLSFLGTLIEYHKREGSDATLGVTEVDDVTRHGIITHLQGKILNITEKPGLEQAASNLGSIGLYVFEPCIFDAIQKTQPGHNGEYQLTDSINILIAEGKKVLYKKMDGIHIDIGTPEDLIRANALMREKTINFQC